jgi:hypothetical protein
LNGAAAGIARAWHWLTTTRYTRSLEERVARLEAENLHLRNAIYARAGVGPVTLGTAAGAVHEVDRKAPQPVRRPISWIQVKQKLESEGALRTGKREDGTNPRSENR